MGEDIEKVNKQVSLPVLECQRFMVFNSANDLEKFIVNEREKWGDFFSIDIPGMSHLRSGFAGIVIQIFNRIQGLYEFWAKDPNVPELEERLLVTEEILSCFPFPFSNHSLGQEILQIAGSNHVVAFFLVYIACHPVKESKLQEVKSLIDRYKALINKPVSVNSPPLASTHWLSYLLEAQRRYAQLEVKKIVKSNESLFSHLNDDIDLIKELKTVAQSEIKSHEKWRDEARKRLDSEALSIIKDIQIQAREFQQNYKNEASQTNIEVMEKLSAAEAAYREKIGVAESTRYWELKKSFHEAEKKDWFKYIVVLLIATGASPLIIYLLFFLVNYKWELFPADKLIYGFYNPYSLALSVLSVSILGYAIRFCSNQYSSHQHLFLESEERRTMIMTYLALMQENKLKESEDRKIALESLFRPAQTGIVADHGPIVPTETVIKVIEKQAKVV